MAHKDKDEVAQIVASHLQQAIGDDMDELTARRSDNLARYQGEFYGDEVEGRSKVMDRSVLEQVEQCMPALARAFLSTENIGIFEPNSPDQEEQAKQATDYVNHVLMRDSDGYRITLDWLRSALITGTSVAKLWWEENEETMDEVYSGLSEAELQQLITDEDVEVLEHSAFGVTETQLLNEQDAMVAALEDQQVEVTHEVKIRHTKRKPRLCWEAVPPEEFLVNKRARSLDEKDHTWTFAAHRQLRTVQSLLDEGYDEDMVMSADTYNGDYNMLFEQRYDDLTTVTDSYSDTDPKQRRVELCEAYIRCDYDGSGEKLHRVTCLGGYSNTTVLEIEPVNFLPFAELTAIRRPHRLMGYSLADLVKDLQRLKTSLVRGMMDGLYHSLYPRLVTDEQRTDLDDLLSESPGSIIRVQGNPQTAVLPLNTQWSGSQAFPMLQYIDGQLQRRTGITEMGAGLDANVLQSETARAVDEQSMAARARIELICRSMAHGGFTRLLMLAYKMLMQHQDHERVVKLRGKTWTAVDPRTWTADLQVRVNTALGTGTKAEQVQKLNFIAQKQEAIMAQMGIANPLAPLPAYYQSLRKLAEAADLEPDMFFADPTMAMQQQAQQPPPPSPEQMKMQAEMQVKQKEAQDKLALQRDQNAQEAELARYKADLEATIQRETAALKADLQREIAAQKLELDKEIEANRHMFRMNELEMERELEREKMIVGSRDGQGNINVSD